MGNCAGKCELCLSPQQRLKCTARCNNDLAVQDYSESETTNLLAHKENIDSSSARLQSFKNTSSSCVTPCFPFAKESKSNIIQFDPMLIEFLSQKVVRSPLVSANGNLVFPLEQEKTVAFRNNVDESRRESRASSGEMKESSKKPASELQFYIVTWNMNGKLQAPLKNISKLLDVTGEKYDFYVVGLQEAPNFLGGAIIAEALGDSYCRVGGSVMMSLQLYVFAKKSLRHYITGSMGDKVGVGNFGTGVVGRQKGAAAVFLRYNKVSLLFITSHLAPHEYNLEARNSQYDRICQSVFTRPTGLCSSCNCIQPIAVEEPHCKVRLATTSYVEDCDVVVWLGDLNYRVEMPRSSVGFLISHNLEEVLWSKDQLSRAVLRGEVFKGFEEGPLLFPPTYKFDVGTDNYDSSAKERVPSWTDRILYKVKKTSQVKAELRGYTSINSVKTSDHRPVKAHLALKHLNV